MDGGGSPEERGAERLMDDYLKSIGLHRKRVAKDGSCLFRVVAEQVLHCQSLHTVVRAKCVAFLRRNREQYEAFVEGDFTEYVDKLQDPQQWVGEVEINALAVMYRRDFLIFQEPGKPAVNITGNNFKEKVLLCFLNGNHYDSVYPICRLESAALCQSVLYELLYQRVFHINQSLLGVCQRTGRPSDLPIDDNMAACGSSDESDADANEPLWIESETTTSRYTRGRGRGRYLPERVRRSLNPTLFRNIEYDMWLRTKRAQQKMDYCIAAGMQYSPGDRCKVCLDGSGKSYNATVKEVPPNNGLVSVYIEELGKRQVPLWSLRPLSDDNSWSTVVSRDRRLSNGHGDWEDRGKGRGKGRHLPASSSLSGTMALGTSGRGQKQPPWPPQAPVEEQGGLRASRKPASVGSPALHPTEKQDLTKQEEEQKVEVVDMQLTDELSFPALERGPVPQGDGGRKKGGEKKRLQRNKPRSPLDDVGALLPCAGEPPPASTSPPPPGNPPAVKMTATVASSLPPGPVARAQKRNAPSYALAVGATSTTPPATATAPPPAPSSTTVFLTPVLPAASSPPVLNTHSSSLHPFSSLSRIPSPPSFSSRPPTTSSSSSSPPSASLPPPTFIAPVAPPPGAVQGYFSSSSLPRSSLPVSPVSHSPSPPLLSPSSSSSPHSRPAAHLNKDPTKTPNSVKDVGVTLTAPQTSPSPASLPQVPPQVQSQAPPQVSPQVLPEVPPLGSLSPDQSEISVSQTRAPSPPGENQSHSLLPTDRHHHQVRSPSHTGEASEPQNQTASMPHLSQSESEAAPGPQGPIEARLSHIHHIKTQTSPPAHSQQSHYPPPPQHPHMASVHPFHPQTLTGAFPMQQLSQLYLDPLYPGFPLGEKGHMAPTPTLSSSEGGGDLPRDPNVLRWFFNLGVKAYSMPMFPPYMYLLPLQQAHTMHPRQHSPSPSPSPHYPSSTPPTRHEEPHPHYSQYNHQTTSTDPPQSADLLSQAGYPVFEPLSHRLACPLLPWQQHHIPPPTNASFSIGYPTPYPVPQAYRPQYLSTIPVWYRSTREEAQVGHGGPEPPQHASGDTPPGSGPRRAPGPPAASSVNANGQSGAPGSALKEEQEGSLTGGVLLVDPPLNNTPILVSNPGVKDAPVSMTTMKPSSIPGSLSSYDITKTATDGSAHGYHGHQNLTPYTPPGAPEPGQGDSPSNVAECLSVGCSTEDDWDEQAGFKPTTLNPRGSRRIYRGASRGRSSYDPGRGAYRRRYAGDMGTGYSYIQYSSSYRGRGHERGY
ncbi:OTU domain-containing protein 4 [Antennarius striatus]|uniref:OTU domain-containing protein 4 n=1 Tax=Antennarius striatus TaxID=241820 RepID=UPI0035ADB11C